jgi:uncharacterized membrane protein YuzA (DUF378 family)
MPFALLIVGVLFLVLGIRGTQKDFITLLRGDFTGAGNFIYFIVGILVVGAIGYIPRFKTLSDAFLVLILVKLFLDNGGFFNQFQQQVFNRVSTPSVPSVESVPGLPALPPLPSLTGN